ncbi:glutaminyl-peptide cyclotransferase [Parafilimonas sp.]|uniref:glutaminyl-peptide cyclotransferase n=1 Tax=Parafilimonas sp. TaxID=1969739 RepID=UPI0039E345AF
MKLQYRLLCLLLFSACNTSQPDNTVNDNSNPAPPMINYSIVKVYPHDTSSYTEGLEWRNNSLYESGGNYGSSRLHQTTLEGKKLQSLPLAKEFFGEGITLLNNKIYQLTYREHKVFVYDAATFKKIKEMEWPYEGWGMTNNGKDLIISTGSSVLYFVDPENFKILNQVSVTDNYGPVSNLNELEYVNNRIYANIWQTDYIVKIDPETGRVTGKLDAGGILQKSGIAYNPEDYPGSNGNVLNGIAYDSARNSFYITGKKWPALFEIKLNN